MKNILIIIALSYGMACSAKETKTFDELRDISYKTSPEGFLCTTEKQEAWGYREVKGKNTTTIETSNTSLTIGIGIKL